MIHAILRLKDVLAGGEVNGKPLPVVDVVVIQHGTQDFEIESVEGTNDEELIEEAMFVAIHKAIRAPEDLWDYRLVD